MQEIHCSTFVSFIISYGMQHRNKEYSIFLQIQELRKNPWKLRFAVWPLSGGDRRVSKLRLWRLTAGDWRLIGWRERMNVRRSSDYSQLGWLSREDWACSSKEKSWLQCCTRTGTASVTYSPQLEAPCLNQDLNCAEAWDNNIIIVIHNPKAIHTT